MSSDVWDPALSLRNNLKLRTKTNLVTNGSDATVYVRFLDQILYIYIYVYLRVSKQKLDVYRCIHSSYDILGFDAKIQIIVGTVWATVQLSVQVYSIYCKTYVI